MWPSLAAALCAALLADGRAFASVAAFENKHVTFTLEENATATLVEKPSGRELCMTPTPFALARFEGGSASAVRIEKRGEDRFAAVFSGDRGEFTFAIHPFKHGWTVEALECTVPGWTVLEFARFVPTCSEYVGWSSNVISDDDSAVAVRTYSPCMTMIGHRGLVAASAVAERGALKGLKCGIAAGTRKAVLLGLKYMTKEAGVRISKCGGAWALDSEDNRRSYIFAGTLGPKTVDKWIEFAKMSGIGILHRDGWYAIRGHYPVRKDIFPGGESDLKRMTDKIHAAGLLAGLHQLSGCIDLKDNWVTPSVSPDLKTDYEYTLAKPLADGDTEVVVNEEPGPKHDIVYTYSSNGNFLRIGTELVQYTGIRRTKPYAFTGVKRATFGTKKGGPYPAGMTIGYLHQHYLAFFPAVGSYLSEQLAEAVSGVYNRGGFDQIYFDGADTGHGDAYEIDMLCREFYDRFDRPVIAEGGGNKNSWWWRSRIGAWDHPLWGMRKFHDTHIAAAKNYRMAEFLQPQLGWWCPRAADKNTRGHFVDEMEYFAAKCAAIDGVSSMQGVDPVNKGLSDELKRQFEVFGNYERLRLANAFNDRAIKALGEYGKEFRLKATRDGDWALVPVETQIHRVSGECGRKWTWKPGAGTRLSLRFESLYTAGAGASVKMLQGGALPRKNVTEAPYLDLGQARAFKLRVKGDGSGNALHLRVSTPREYMAADSDHYVKIDFTGWRDVVFTARERDAGGTDYVIPEKYGHYNTFRNPLVFEHISKIEAKVHEDPESDAVEISDVFAVPIARQTPVKPVLAIGETRIACPFSLKSGEYAELEVNGKWTHWSEEGNIVANSSAGPKYVFPDGEVPLELLGDPNTRVEVSLFALGKPFIAAKGIPAEKPGKSGKDGRKSR